MTQFKTPLPEKIDPPHLELVYIARALNMLIDLVAELREVVESKDIVLNIPVKREFDVEKWWRGEPQTPSLKEQDTDDFHSKNGCYYDKIRDGLHIDYCTCPATPTLKKHLLGEIRRKEGHSKTDLSLGYNLALSDVEYIINKLIP